MSKCAVLLHQNTVFADLLWFHLSSHCSDVQMYSRTLWHRCWVWLLVQPCTSMTTPISDAGCGQRWNRLEILNQAGQSVFMGTHTAVYVKNMSYKLLWLQRELHHIYCIILIASSDVARVVVDWVWSVQVWKMKESQGVKLESSIRRDKWIKQR